jgi:hypothetical protein
MQPSSFAPFTCNPQVLLHNLESGAFQQAIDVKGFSF